MRTIGIVERLRESAHAFRRHDIYDSEGDACRLTVQADECDEAAGTITDLLEELQTALDEREQEHGRLPDGSPHWSVRARAAIAKARGEQA